MLLLERDFSQPDRIVGELLQPGGYLMLKKLGLEDCTDSIDSVKVQSKPADQQHQSALRPALLYNFAAASASWKWGLSLSWCFAKLIQPFMHDDLLGTAVDCPGAAV